MTTIELSMNDILVIEDEHPIRNNLLTLLSQKGYNPLPASDGNSGLKHALKNKFKAIILDYNLPKTDGLAICNQLRKKGIYTPILILTGNNEIEFKVKLLQEGADDYVTKPFEQEELCARLKALLKRPATYYPHDLHEKSIFLNSLTHRVTKNNKPIALTKKEYAILEYLLRNKGTIITRNHLFEHVWDRYADICSNTLEAHIVSLRKKLGFKRDQFITCVSGRGYIIKTS